MENLYHQYRRSQNSLSPLTTTCLMVLIVFIIQGPHLVVAQKNGLQSAASNAISKTNDRSTTSTSIPSLNDETHYDGDTENGGFEIYEDNDGFEETSTTTHVAIPIPSLPNSSIKPNSSVHIANPESAAGTEYNDGDDEGNSYQDESNDDGGYGVDDETTEHSDPNSFGNTMPINRGEQRPPNIDSNKKDTHSTSRMPLVPASLWRDLFSKPGILVGIIGGIVIGMLSAILLVMFIIYRMRKKDEGSYALEEGPRKSPSHAYTRVSSREFFA